MKTLNEIKLDLNKSKINIINQILGFGTKRIDFDDLNEYCVYKKTTNELKKQFRWLGYVPTCYVKNDSFYVVEVIRYKKRNRYREFVFNAPMVSAFGTHKNYGLNLK